MQTPEKEKGTRFEIWLELLLKLSGHQNVLRNVEYHRERFVFRQVDISYDIVREGRLYLAIVEAKYSSNGQVHYKLRKGELRKSGQQIPKIDNLVDEVLERQRFVGAHVSYLVTNRSFNGKVREEAKKRRIDVIEGDGLTAVYKQLGGKGTIDDSINSVDLGRYNLHKSIIYIPWCSP